MQPLTPEIPSQSGHKNSDPLILHRLHLYQRPLVELEASLENLRASESKILPKRNLRNIEAGGF